MSFNCNEPEPKLNRNISAEVETIRNSFPIFFVEITRADSINFISLDIAMLDFIECFITLPYFIVLICDFVIFLNIFNIFTSLASLTRFTA
ncbi:hypothetical protein BCR33DRAFT_330472 [Rhizoclosmatium globosum]|uniref:Uncharacterized protein n=1 Tax=Rhizoclosmatium globosum TaxID=329046 RepID=A0A1Y2C592_9FUNG|nr:hypothetical protein BCR33DRAFT_330472 [Rhizoclosmatium globosum]|eukprot:ORY42047.1 hypothetical protein BCR33DRAFT_330472 [Rhizoclosmatium globosum]